MFLHTPHQLDQLEVWAQGALEGVLVENVAKQLLPRFESVHGPAVVAWKPFVWKKIANIFDLIRYIQFLKVSINVQHRSATTDGAVSSHGPYYRTLPRLWQTLAVLFAKTKSLPISAKDT